jgi:glucokinase
MKKCAIGIDIGGTNTKLGLVTSTGELFFHEHFKTEEHSKYPSFEKVLFEKIREILDKKSHEAALKDLPLAGLGVGAPNANFNTGLLESPVNIPWGTIKLQERLKNEFQIPVVLDNDANAAALGEARFGVAQGVKDFILVTLGTGVGTGILSQGKILRSEPGKAGEGGHITIFRDGRACGCGGSGHLESYASSRGVRQTALEITGQSLGAREICDLFIQSDAKAIKVVDFTAECLGFALANMCSLLNPTLIVLGGGVSLLSPDLAQRVEKWLKHYTFRIIREDARVVLSDLQAKQGSVLGASTLVF